LVAGLEGAADALRQNPRALDAIVTVVPKMRPLFGVLLCLFALAIAPAASPGRHALRGRQPRGAVEVHSLGAATGTVTVRVYLTPRGGLAALKRAALAVSTPGTRRYRHFLTPRQFRALYGPTRGSVRRVEASLRARGMTILSVEHHRRWVTARGSVSAAQAAFGTRLERFRRANRIVRAPTRKVRLPATIAGDVLAVSGLDSTPHVVHPAATLPPPDARLSTLSIAARPCSRWHGEKLAQFEADGVTPLPPFRGAVPPYAVCGYGPRQLRSAYLGRTRLTGRGVTIAEVNPFASRTMRADANHYARRHGDRPFRRGQYSERLPRSFSFTGPASCGTPDGWLLEETLDIEAIHAMAPGANIRFYAARSCDDPQDPGTIAALDAVVDENRASVVTNSYGDPEAAFTPGVRAGYEQAFLQAAMQGISVFYSSGDDGSRLIFPASDPWVTAVGGTSAAIGRRGRLLFQTGWATDAYALRSDRTSWTPFGSVGGAGGGFSALFARPGWQRGVVPSRSPARRAVPDLAHVADGTTGMAIGETLRFPDGDRYAEMRLGGTSLASPLMAGTQALAVQSSRGRLGWANPSLYRQYRRRAHTFTDVTERYAGRAAVRVDRVDVLDPGRGVFYGLRSFGDSSGFGTPLQARRGWDPVTGLGTPNARYVTRQGR
jgi:subtilase family serine protease